MAALPSHSFGMQMMMPGVPPMMRSPPLPIQSMAGAQANNIQEIKKEELECGIFVTGLPPQITYEILFKSFSEIKNILAIKMPMKDCQNYGYAFIYYENPASANEVIRAKHKTIFFGNRIRVMKAVMHSSISKMIFKLKNKNASGETFDELKKTVWNEDFIEKTIANAVEPFFKGFVTLQKVDIPVSRESKETLKYGRAYFHTSNLKEAEECIRFGSSSRPIAAGAKEPQPSKYTAILQDIERQLNSNEEFSKYMVAEVYEYIKKNNVTTLHLKGVKYEADQTLESIKEKLGDYIRSLNPQWRISDIYARSFGDKSGWANIIFENELDAKSAYDLLKSSKHKFRDEVLYANLRNVRDSRTVVLSEVDGNIPKSMIKLFFDQIAENSQVMDGADPSMKKFSFFSLGVAPEKTFYQVSPDEVISIEKKDESQKKDEKDKKEEVIIQPYWTINRVLARRVIIHFYNGLKTQDIATLSDAINNHKDFNTIFSIRKSLRVNHQRGHLQGGNYVAHRNTKEPKPAPGPGQLNQNRNRPRENKEHHPRQTRQQGPMYSEYTKDDLVNDLTRAGAGSSILSMKSGLGQPFRGNNMPGDPKNRGLVVQPAMPGIAPGIHQGPLGPGRMMPPGAMMPGASMMPGSMMQPPGPMPPGHNQTGMKSTVPGMFRPDMPGMNMPGMNMPGMNMPGMNMPGMNMPGMNMPGMNMPGMNMPGMNMPGMNMPGGMPGSMNTPGGMPGPMNMPGGMPGPMPGGMPGSMNMPGGMPGSNMMMPGQRLPGQMPPGSMPYPQNSVKPGPLPQLPPQPPSQQ